MEEQLPADRPHGGPSERSQDCVLLFADLSGFSTVSARLVAEDTRGAERIHDILNGHIRALVDGVAAHGGRVLWMPAMG